MVLLPVEKLSQVSVTGSSLPGGRTDEVRDKVSGPWRGDTSVEWEKSSACGGGSKVNGRIQDMRTGMRGGQNPGQWNITHP